MKRVSDGTATAFAPATVANVGVGFDVLGFALAGVGDEVTLRAAGPAGEVTIEAIEGVVRDLPRDPRRNTAAVALSAALALRPAPSGFALLLRKGIPLGSGMGGSAASAVAAVVAANALLDPPLSADELLHCALEGEAAASGARHADNAAPCLHGGLTAVVSGEPPRVVRLPLPSRLISVLVHPHLTIETRRAREALPAAIPLGRHVAQSMRLAGFLAGCFTDDRALVARSMVDLVNEPARGPLIPGFERAKRAAREAGALAFGIAGSGPSVFAWTEEAATAEAVREATVRAFAAAGLASDAWIGPLGAPGARLVEPVR